MDPDGNNNIVPMEQTAEFFRRVALKADDEILVRACLLLAAKQLDRLAGERALPTVAVNDAR